MTNPANFDDLYGAPKPNPPVRGQKPQGMFDDLYAPAPITPEEKSFADQLDALMSSPARPPIGPIPGPLWQPGTPEEAPPSVGPAEHQGFGWDMLGFGKELIRDPLGTLYNMVGRPIVHTLLDKQPTSAEEQTAMLATMFPASQLANPELQQLTARVRDNIESRRQTLGLIASAAAGGAAGEMSALARAGTLPTHIVAGGEFATLAAGYDTEQAKKNLAMILAISGPTAIVNSLIAKAIGRAPIPIDAVSERTSAIREARSSDPLKATEEPAISGINPIPGTEGRGFEVTGERVTPPIPPETPTLAEMTGMSALQHEPVSAPVSVPKPDLYTKFSDYSRSIDEHPELHSPDVPRVDDIKDKYPGAYYRALEYDDPNEAMFQFADQLSTQVENREISAEMAESLGGRFKAYLDARQSVLLKNSFSARVQAFARMNGIPDSHYDALYKEMADRVGEELRMRHLEPDEYSAYHEIAERVKQVRGQAFNLGKRTVDLGYHEEYGRQAFDYPIEQSGQEVGVINVDYDNATKALNIRWIGERDFEGAGPSRLKLGVSAVAGLRDQLLKDFPEARIIKGERFSGVRRGMHGRTATIEVPVQPTNELASSNAMIVEPASTGEVVRDATSGELLVRTSGPEETRQFIRESGQAAGVSLDGGGDNKVPPVAIAGDAMPPQTPPPSMVNRVDDELNWRPPGSNWFEKVLDLWRGTAHHFNVKEAYYNGLDGIYRDKNTKFASRFFYPLLRALQETQAAAHPWRERVRDIWKESKSLSHAQLDKVVNWLESISSDELINGSNEVGRPANEREINAANLIVHSGVDDVPKLLKFARLSAEIRANFKPELVENELNQLRAEYNLTPAEESVAGLFEQIRGFSPDQISLGLITRLADTIKHDSPSRGEYMAKNQFTPQMINVAHLWDEFYREISNLTGIDAKKLLQSYFPHYKMNPDAPSLEQSYLFQHGAIPDRTYDFASRMIRTGEIDAYERDPNVSGFRYVNALFKDRFLNPTIKEAAKAASEELGKVDSRARDKLRQIMINHLRIISGRPDIMSNFTQDAVENTLKNLGIQSDASFRRKIVDTFSMLIYGAGVSFRAQLVLRHVNQMIALGFAEYGGAALMRALSHLDGLTNGRFKELKDKGVIPGLGPTPFTSQAEEAGFLGATLDKADEWTRKFSQLGMAGVRGVYDVSHFIWYEEGRARALNYLNKWKSGEMDFQSALDKMQLGKYKLGVQQRVVEYARNGKISEAAHEFGQATGRKVTFMYGYANSPAGWESNAGRLIGTFGVWPAWMQDYTYDMMTRGTLTQRIGKMSRFAMAQGAVWLSGRAFGLDMTPFYMGPGFFLDNDILRGFAETASPLAVWAGGPFIGMANTAIQSVKEPNESLRKYARVRLMRQILAGFIPGRGAVTDISEALKNAQDARFDDPIHFFARVAGVKPSDLQGWLFSQ